MKGGPGLMFVYLVNVFNAMPGGRIVGMIFYICVLFAGVSSIVNLYEAPVAFLQEKLHTNRVLSVVIIGAVGGVIACASSLGPLSGWTLSPFTSARWALCWPVSCSSGS